MAQHCSKQSWTRERSQNVPAKTFSMAIHCFLLKGSAFCRAFAAERSPDTAANSLAPAWPRHHLGLGRLKNKTKPASMFSVAKAAFWRAPAQQPGAGAPCWPPPPARCRAPRMQSTVYSASAINVHLIGHLCSLLPPLLLRGPSECEGEQPPIHQPPPWGPPSPLPGTHKREVAPMSSGVWRPAEELES